MYERRRAMRKNKKYLTETRYNNIQDRTKEDIGFPTNYLFLTNAQERFILDLLDGHEKAIKKDLLEMMNEMKELVDEI
jgi:hypothetical protein|tara:strand:+ start:735 stop:968 length:234 start_codon:yes stop_codon:yes gene_type:complete